MKAADPIDTARLSLALTDPPPARDQARLA